MTYNCANHKVQPRKPADAQPKPSPSVSFLHLQTSTYPLTFPSYTSLKTRVVSLAFPCSFCQVTAYTSVFPTGIQEAHTKISPSQNCGSSASAQRMAGAYLCAHAQMYVSPFSKCLAPSGVYLRQMDRDTDAFPIDSLSHASVRSLSHTFSLFHTHILSPFPSRICTWTQTWHGQTSKTAKLIKGRHKFVPLYLLFFCELPVSARVRVVGLCLQAR